jgi:hypothetical protein
MSQKISQQPLSTRFEHLVSVISSPRFLEMRGLNNDLPFYICEFKATEAFEMQRMQGQLTNTLASLSVECLGGRGIKVLEVNLYDLCIDLLKAREGSSPDTNLWDEILAIESEVEKDSLLELLQNVLDIGDYLIPAIGERLSISTEIFPGVSAEKLPVERV